MKKVQLKRHKCIGCAICAQLLPDVFLMDQNDGKAALNGQPKKQVQSEIFHFMNEASLAEAKNKCPVNAIEIL